MLQPPKEDARMPCYVSRRRRQGSRCIFDGSDGSRPAPTSSPAKLQGLPTMERLAPAGTSARRLRASKVMPLRSTSNDACPAQTGEPERSRRAIRPVPPSARCRVADCWMRDRAAEKCRRFRIGTARAVPTGTARRAPASRSAGPLSEETIVSVNSDLDCAPSSQAISSGSHPGD